MPAHLLYGNGETLGRKVREVGMNRFVEVKFACVHQLAHGGRGKGFGNTAYPKSGNTGDDLYFVFKVGKAKALRPYDLAINGHCRIDAGHVFRQADGVQQLMAVVDGCCITGGRALGTAGAQRQQGKGNKGEGN